MSSLDQLASQQNEVGAEIERIITNYKKDSLSRKTNDYLDQKSKAVTDLWEKFQSVDYDIRARFDAKDSHPYFAKKYFANIKKLYDGFLRDVKELKQSISGASESKTSACPDPQIAVALRRLNAAISMLQRALDNAKAIPPHQNTTVYDVKCRSIQRLWTNVESLHDALWVTTDDPGAFGFNQDQYFDLSDEVETTAIELQTKLAACSSQSVPVATDTAPRVKLPTISLPKFDGNYIKWKHFHDLFVQVVHQQTLGEAQKMWYLKTSLTGEAEQCISHLSISDANYISAWEMLRNRYDNKRLLVTALLDKLLSQPNIHAESAAAIRALHDTTRECLLSLQNLQIDIKSWDPLLLHLLIRKLDNATHKLYEQGLPQPRDLQSLENFLVFLERRFQSLEALTNKNNKNAVIDHNNSKRSSSKTLTVITSTSSCLSCKGDHPLPFCRAFLNMSPERRLRVIQRAGHCINCLKSGHRTSKCQAGNCRKCAKKHNTLLHLEGTQPKLKPGSSNLSLQQGDNEKAIAPSKPTSPEVASLSSNTADNAGSYTMLSTALLKVRDRWGNEIEARAILDSGSQLNFISERLLRKLGLQETKHAVCIGGIGLSKQDAQSRASIQIRSIVTDFNVTIEAHVLPKIISQQPSQYVKTTSWSIPNNIRLADPHFHRPGPIDILIGAELFYPILAVGQIRLGDQLPTLQNTLLGWTVSGRISAANPSANRVHCGICSEDERLDAHIQKFWQLEEAETPANNYTAAENKCEEFFVQTTRRDESGRFIVRLPFRQDPQVLGESSDNALRRFHSLERKLSKNATMKQQYVEFMKEYIRLGHMKETCFAMIPDQHYFLPHHCVLKPESTTTKLRVVFDASAKTTTNVSLNDVLATGPAIQGDVFTVLLRFRLPRYVFTADIEKMYRQVQIDPADRKFQLIWWRSNPDEPLKCYQLNTITYGTASASYLATRTLHALADAVQHKYPLGAHSLKHDFYVDDVLAGSDHLPTCAQRQAELASSLGTAGIKLRKWCANHPQLLTGIRPEDQAIELDFNDQSNDAIKTMGLTWQPKSDSFMIRSAAFTNRNITKRTASSDIAHIFDPLGILAPVVITAKLFLQGLWGLKLDWDAAIPQHLHTTWLQFREGLACLNHITFPRHVLSHKTTTRIQLHVFADASERAYGAAAYIRAIHRDDTITVRLLCAKTKVAPVKQITLPRLELCAAKLAMQLKQRVKKDLQLEDRQTFLWTDSTVVLGWIKAESSSFHTFVANRISAIQRSTIPEQWRHVKSTNNPADLLSRGIPPEKLASSNLWFYGPTFLHGKEDSWPQLVSSPDTCLPEARTKHRFVCASTTDTDDFILGINHKNSFRRLQRIVGYLIRFINVTRGHPIKGSPHSLSVNELGEAQRIIVRHVQQQSFRDDINHIAKYGEVAKNSTISSLTPFLDQDSVLRVGGRLESSNLDYQAKHPALLPSSHAITEMILNELHRENLHAGPQALLAITRQQFWPLGGKNVVRSVINHCVRCTRAKPKLLSQLMGNLPADRVQPARPFVNSGVDFCGPVFVHFKIRGKQPQKAYIAVFCCFATKAVHLELVSDLSTEGFLGALRRFTSRRGHCRKIYCDNATNFVGARNQLQELQTIFNSDSSKDKLRNECSSRGIDFQFIPPRAPHFGGLWEAAVKSAKRLMQHTLASASLTYEEMETVVVGVEAVLNSRPITPLSNDANDPSALTPAHFLIGEPLTACVDPQAQPQQVSLLTRWKLVNHIKNEFWKRWSSEYLNELQHRHKWKQAVPNVTPGTMVILKEDNVPPLKWPLGRITNVIKGEDGLVRVVDVKTANNILRRPIHRLAPLPAEEDKASETQIQTATQPAAGSSKATAEPRASSQPSPTPAKRSRSALLSCLLVCLLLLPCKGTPASVQPFATNPGLYFENLGSANVIISEWNVIVYYDMLPYWNDFRALQSCGAALQNLTSVMSQPALYNKITEQVNRTITDLNQNNVMLQVPNPIRTKRGAINVIGSAANFLFGVLDSKYAEKMSSTIDAIRDNENHLADLLRNQTSIMDATINIMKRDSTAISQEFARIQSHLSLLSAQMANAAQEESRSTSFMLLSLQTMLLAVRLQRTQGLILDSLTNTQRGLFSKYLMSPEQLKEALVTIHTNLPPNIRLPIADDDVLHLYSLISLEGRMTTKHAIFKMRVPLISVEDFELFRVIPVPVRMNNTFVAISPSFPFLIINLHRDQYYPLSEGQLRVCVNIVNRYLCNQRFPLYKVGSSVAACEVKLLNKMSPYPECRVMTMNSQPSWIQLHSPNQWIFSLQEETAINIVCGQSMSQLTIRDAGILTVDSDCVIKQPMVTIHGYRTYSTVTREAYIPSFNLSDVMRASNSTSSVHYQHHYAPHIRELEDLRERLTAMDTQVPKLIGSHSARHYTLGSVTLLFVVGLLAGLVWTIIRLRPTPGASSAAAMPPTEHHHQRSPRDPFTVEDN